MTRPLSWRINSPGGNFDEIVVGSGAGMILHAEMMDSRTCFIDVAGLCLWVHVDKKGRAIITSSDDRRDDVIMASGLLGIAPMGSASDHRPPRKHPKATTKRPATAKRAAPTKTKRKAKW